MKLDNSMAKTWHQCPWKYKEKYIDKIDRKYKTSDALPFGKRMHHLLECRLRKILYLQKYREGYNGHLVLPPEPAMLEPFEPEAQAMFAAYEAKYPVEPFDVIDVERYFEVPLPRQWCEQCKNPFRELYPEGPRCVCATCGTEYTQHIYIGKFDGIIRSHASGKLDIFEHKTEKRGSKANLPTAWAVRPQVGLYIWAAEQIYQEEFDQILLDVLTRQSPAGQIPPTFSRQNLQRSPEQKQDAINNIIWVADQIEAMTAKYAGQEKWPFDGEQCAPNNWQCEFYPLHIFGRAEFTLERDFGPAEEYLTL